VSERAREQGPRDKNARIYPCHDCGVMRSDAEGGTTFTVCDECWDKSHPKERGPREDLLEMVRSSLASPSPFRPSARALLRAIEVLLLAPNAPSLGHPVLSEALSILSGRSR
jgi:hypothetical protein